MNLESVRRDDWILAGVTLLLIIDLLAFPWFNFGLGGPFTVDLTGTDAPDGWAGILAVIALLALIADLALERFAPQTTLPAVNGSRTMTRFVLAVVAAFFVFLKFILNIHFSGILSFSWGFYLAVILTVALVYLALQARNAPAVPAARPPAAGPPPAGPPPA
jgi:hypothetical protein